MHEGIISLLFWKPMKYLKSCLPKRSLLDANNSLISISSIEIGLLS